MTDRLSLALGQTVSGYGTIRPIAPAAPAPIVMQQPTSPPPTPEGGVLGGILNIKPEQLMQMALFIKQMIDAVKGATVVGGAGAGP
jgi:hypothetical protein